jgi:hypothetical protein
MCKPHCTNLPTMQLSCGHWACDFHGEHYLDEWRTQAPPQGRMARRGVARSIVQRAYEFATPRCVQCNGQLTLTDINTVLDRLFD